MTPEQKTRLIWLLKEDFELTFTEQKKVYFKDLDKERKGRPTPQCDVTDLWNNTTGVTPEEFAELMMDHANDRFCFTCHEFVDEDDILFVDDDVFPYVSGQMCDNCCYDAQENDEGRDEYARNGVSRSDFI